MIMDKNKYIEFTEAKDQEIIFDKTVRKINFDQFKLECKEKAQTFLLKVYLMFENNNSCAFPMTITINKDSHRDDNSTYRAAYSFDLTHVKKLVVTSNDLLPLKLYYHFEEN